MTSMARDGGGEFWGNRLEPDSGAVLLGHAGASHKMPVTRLVCVRKLGVSGHDLVMVFFAVSWWLGCHHLPGHYLH